MSQSTFPYRLYDALEEIGNTANESSIVSWTPTGRTFRIHDLDAFKDHILPKYFPKQNKYKSFRRQLQYYGFYTLGRNHFGHRLFVRNQKDRLPHIKHRKGQPSIISSQPPPEHEFASLAFMLESKQVKISPPSLSRSEERVTPRNSLVSTPRRTSLLGGMEPLKLLSRTAISPSDSKISSHLRGAQTKSLEHKNSQLLDPAEKNAMQVKRKLDLDILLLTLQRQKVAEDYASSLLEQQTNSTFIDLARFQLGL